MELMTLVGLLALLSWGTATAVAGRPVGAQAAAEAILPSRRRLRAAQRRAQAVRAQLQRYPYPAGWAQAVPADTAAAITGWPGAAGDEARRFLCYHWQLTYDADAFFDLRAVTCTRCGAREGDPPHTATCPDAPKPRSYRTSISYDMRHYDGGRVRAVLREPPVATWVDIGRELPPPRDEVYDLIREPCDCKLCARPYRNPYLTRRNRY